MGPANRELALAHDARRHAHALASIFAGVSPRRDPVDAPLRELARLVRLEAATARRAHEAAAEADAAGTRANALDRELADTRAANEQLQAHVAELEHRLHEAEARAEQAEAQKGGRVRALLGREAQSHSSEG
jgi:chromosome segregation ATPase